MLVTAEGPLLRDFRRASSSAPAMRTERDLAAAVAAAAAVVGTERAVAATCRVLDTETIQAVLTRLQRSTLDPETERMARPQKGFLKRLRESLATAAGVEVPKLVEAKRISWPNLLMVIGSLVGLWLIIGVLTDAAGSLSVIRGAAWGWVAAAFVLGQLPVVTGAWALTGAVMAPLPFGRCVALETSNMFTSFVGGDAAVFGVRVRFFQRQGLDTPAAISSGAIAGTASWVVKGALFLLCLPFAWGDFHKPTSGARREPPGHRLDHPHRYSGRRRPRGGGDLRPPGAAAGGREGSAAPGDDLEGREGHRGGAAEDRLRAGGVARQPGPHRALPRGLPPLGGRARQLRHPHCGADAGRHDRRRRPVPGGAGVIEVGLIAGLSAAGIPQDQAVAAVFIERFCTAYLPPIWGWATLVWLRRSDYI